MCDRFIKGKLVHVFTLQTETLLLNEVEAGCRFYSLIIGV